MSLLKHAAKSESDHPRHAAKSDRDAAPAQRTTDVEDIQLLSDEIVALCQTPAYDDMTWAEIDNALMRVSHQIKLIFAEHGTLEPPAALTSRS